MNTTGEDGGPAFPVLTYDRSASGDIRPTPTVYDGMSLRDWFAGMAMQGLTHWAKDPFRERLHASDEKCLAEQAYLYADSMLKAREQWQA